MRRSSLRRSCVPLIALGLVAGLARGVIIDRSTQSIATYVPNDLSVNYPTGVQNILMLHDARQRGVHLDGTARAPSPLGWAIEGNPLESAAGPTRLGPINLATQTYEPMEVDLALPAEGFGWVVGRTFNHRQQEHSGSSYVHHDSNGPQGKNWQQVSQPEIVLIPGATADLDMLYVVYGADRYIELQRTGTSSNYFKAKNGGAGVAVFAANGTNEPETYTYYDQRGNAITFLGFDTDAGAAAGQFWKMVDPKGNTAFVGSATLSSSTATTGYTSGRIEKVYDSSDRRYTYHYDTIDSVARLTQVKAETKTGGTWASPTGVAEVGRVDYAYYTGNSSNGDNGNLKLVTVTTPLTDSGESSVRKTHYRYWVGAYNADTNRGEPNTIKYVIGAEGYRQADWAGDSNFNDTPLTMDMSTDGNKQYASAYFEYDDTYRVTKAWFNGQCGCGGGTNGTYQLKNIYESSSLASSGYGNAVAVRVSVQQPDGEFVTHYFDKVGQALWRASTEADPSGSFSHSKVQGVARDNTTGCVSTAYSDSQLSGYNYSSSSYSSPTIDGTGWDNTRVTSGDATDLIEAVRHAQSGSPTSYFYVSKTPLSTRDFQLASGVTVVRPVVTSSRRYHQTTTDPDATGTYDATSTAYEWWNDTTNTNLLHLVPKKVTITLPTVTTGNNGPGSAVTTERHLRKDGTTAFSKDAEGHFSYTQYSGGQLVKSIVDCKTNGTFASGDDPSTDFGITETSDGTDLTTTYTYDAQGRPDTTTLPDGRVTKMYYGHLADGRLVTISIPRVSTSGTTTYYGPASYTVTNLAGKAEFSGTIAITGSGITTALTSWINESVSDPITALGVGSLAAMSTSIYDKTGAQLNESRAYFLIPGSGAGTSGTNYDATTYAYDTMGRSIRVKAPTGTINRTIYGELGRVTGHTVGTDDTGDTGGMTGGTNNMVQVDKVEYDGGSSYGLGRVTARQTDADGNWSTTTDTRTTTYAYDAFGRACVVVGPQPPYSLTIYDYAGRALATGQYTSSSGLDPEDDPRSQSDYRVALSETFYDEQGRVWKTTRHNINPSDGSDADSIDSLTWYDASGRTIKTKGPSGIQKTYYDRLGRATDRFVVADDNGDSTYNDMGKVTDDYVLEQSSTHYGNTDTALTGKVQMTYSIQRWHDDTSTTGPLDTNADGNSYHLTEGNIKGRIHIAVSWMDELGRVTSSADYGTYGMTGSGSAEFDLATTSGSPPTPTAWLSVPTRSDTILVATSTYDTAGRVVEVEAPGQPASSSTTGMKTHYLFDALGRTTCEIRSYTGASTPISTANRDTDLYTRYVYTNGLRTKLWVDLDGDNTEDTDDQVTTYSYGTTKGSSAGYSQIATGHLLHFVQYPDSTDTETDVVKYAYNAQSQEMWRQDQLKCVIETNYDTAGRVTDKRVTSFGTSSGLDQSIKRISTAYTNRGTVDTVTQYDSATVGSGNPQDQVQYTFDGWGNLTKFEQDVDSAIDETTKGRESFSVQYAYAKRTSTDGATFDTIARSTMTYPNGLVLTYNYDDDTLDNKISRVCELREGEKLQLAHYEYLGSGQVVRTDLPQPNVYSAAYEPAGTPDAYANLDRFGRVTRSRWTNGSTYGTSFYDATVAYDRLSNILSTDDAVPYGSNPGQWADVKYGVDALGRLTDADEGYLSSGSIYAPSRQRREGWYKDSTKGLSQTGNWVRHFLDLNGDGGYTGTGELDDTGTFNKANEWLTRDTDSNGTANYTLTHDAVGNLTNDGKGSSGYKYVYDAFGRLKEVRNASSDHPVAEYRYNGLGYRIGWHFDADADADVDSSDPWYYWCYDERWRMVATYRADDSTVPDGSSGGPKERFVYHAAGFGGYGGSSYIDAVVLRDQDRDTKWDDQADGVLEDRLYYAQNWRADVVATLGPDDSTTNDGLAIREWIKYDSYGNPRVRLAADYNHSIDVDSGDTSAFGTDYGNGSLRADLNFDAGVTIEDQNLFNASYATYKQDAVKANRKLYAGYEYDPYIGGSGAYHVRSRALLPDIGRWIKRDYIGYIGGANLYQYVGSYPALVDPSGLIADSVTCLSTRSKCSDQTRLGFRRNALTPTILGMSRSRSYHDVYYWSEWTDSTTLRVSPVINEYASNSGVQWNVGVDGLLTDTQDGVGHRVYGKPHDMPSHEQASASGGAAILFGYSVQCDLRPSHYDGRPEMVISYTPWGGGSARSSTLMTDVHDMAEGSVGVDAHAWYVDRISPSQITVYGVYRVGGVLSQREGRVGVGVSIGWAGFGIGLNWDPPKPQVQNYDSGDSYLQMGFHCECCVQRDDLTGRVSYSNDPACANSGYPVGPGYPKKWFPSWPPLPPTSPVAPYPIPVE